MRALIALLAFFALTAAAPPRLVSDVSQSRIDIIYSFTGAELLVFGAIQREPGASQPQIAVVVRGPAEPITVRRKEKVLGLWINVDSSRFESAPAFYAVASSMPVRRMLDERTAAIFEIGLDHLQLSPTDTGEAGAFEDGLLALRKRRALYAEDQQGVTITDGVLYRARIVIPARVPVGKYQIDTYLIQDGKVAGASTRTVDIDKSGFERSVALAAENHGLLYGFAAVALALLLGWGAGEAFRRYG